jgi:hypothetical protein
MPKTIEHTTIAYPKTERPVLEILREQYKQERGSELQAPTTKDTLVLAVRECLKRRGIDFLPSPPDGIPVPVVKPSQRVEVTNG